MTNGKMRFYCQCGYPQNHMLPCRHCIRLLSLIDKKYMNKAEVFMTVDEVLKVDSYKKFIEESHIMLPNMSYVKSTSVSPSVLDSEKTGNEPIIFTPLDEQTYNDRTNDQSAPISIEQTEFNRIVPSNIHLGCLRIMRNDVMKVSRYHKLVEVINREIGILNGNMGVRGYEMKKGVEKKENEKETKEEKGPSQPRSVITEIPSVEHHVVTVHGRSDNCRVNQSGMRRVGRMFFEGYEENVMKRVMSDTVFRLNMKNATEMREGKPATSQLFLFVKYYLSPTYNETANHRVLICTTTFVPPLYGCGYDIILIPQFILPSFQYEGAIGHFILNIVDMKEKCVYIVNTLKGIKPKEYKGVVLTSFKCIEVDVHQQTNGTDCGFMCCYYMYRIMKSRIPSEGVSSLIRYDGDEYHSFISHLISSFNLVKKLCEGSWLR